MIQYLDKKAQLFFVAEGLGGGSFGTFYRKNPGGGKHRVKSPALPMRKTRSQAEDDLTWYAMEHDFVPVTISHQE